jgi:hypothetical protein
LSDDEFLREATSIIEKAQSRGITQRVLGSLAVYMHSIGDSELIATYKSLGRFGEGMPMFTDLDLAGYSKQSRAISGLFRELNFKSNDMVNGLFGDRRLIYFNPEGGYQVDVFLNKLEFSHDVHFGDKPGSGRLELDFPTISLTDIVLEKLQIHHINRKDLIDLAVLFLGHEISESDGGQNETVGGRYIEELLSDDWGFWYDAVSNLDKVRKQVGDLTSEGKLTAHQVAIITQRMDQLRRILEESPKSTKWEKRARVGTKKPWYREVEEVVR